jgi:hypothetical protein
VGFWDPVGVDSHSGFMRKMPGPSPGSRDTRAPGIGTGDPGIGGFRMHPGPGYTRGPGIQGPGYVRAQSTPATDPVAGYSRVRLQCSQKGLLFFVFCGVGPEIVNFGPLPSPTRLRGGLGKTPALCSYRMRTLLGRALFGNNSGPGFFGPFSALRGIRGAPLAPGMAPVRHSASYIQNHLRGPCVLTLCFWGRPKKDTCKK